MKPSSGLGLGLRLGLGSGFGLWAHHLNEAEQPTAHLLLLEALAPIPNEARIEVGLSQLEQLAWLGLGLGVKG